MINDKKSNLPDKSGQAAAAADMLYQAVSEAYPNRPLFFQRLDELYMEICEDGEAHKNKFIYLVSKIWPGYFPEIRWTDSLNELADQYQRNCRKWVWYVFNDRQIMGAEFLEAMEAVLKMHALLLGGLSYGEIHSNKSSYIRQELRLQAGTDGRGIPGLVKHLRKSDFDRKLEKLCIKYRENALKAHEAGESQTGKMLQAAQDTLMWMGVVSMKGQEESYSRNAIQETVKILWPNVMDTNPDDFTIDLWADRFIARMGKNRNLPMGLMSHPYKQIRDIPAKANAQFQFCAVYAIACTQGECIDRQAVCASTVELFASSFQRAGLMEDVQAPIGNIINRYCRPDEKRWIDTEVSRYFQRHYDFAEDCFEHMRKLDEDDISSVESEIVRQKSRAAEDIALMYQAQEDKALGNLMETLSNPMHGNIIGQMYLIAGGKKEDISWDEIKRLLNNFFLLMQQKMIMPVWDEDSLYPGWSIRGKTVVRAEKRKEKE